jgi:hypothetical protein
VAAENILENVRAGSVQIVGLSDVDPQAWGCQRARPASLDHKVGDLIAPLAWNWAIEMESRMLAA